MRYPTGEYCKGDAWFEIWRQLYFPLSTWTAGLPVARFLSAQGNTCLRNEDRRKPTSISPLTVFTLRKLLPPKCDGFQLKVYWRTSDEYHAICNCVSAGLQPSLSLSLSLRACSWAEPPICSASLSVLPLLLLAAAHRKWIRPAI